MWSMGERRDDRRIDDALAVALGREAHAVDHQQRTGRRAGVEAADVDLHASFDIRARIGRDGPRRITLAAGKDLNRSAVVSAPVVAKSCGREIGHRHADGRRAADQRAGDQHRLGDFLRLGDNLASQGICGVGQGQHRRRTEQCGKPRAALDRGAH